LIPEIAPELAAPSPVFTSKLSSPLSVASSRLPAAEIVRLLTAEAQQVVETLKRMAA